MAPEGDSPSGGDELERERPRHAKGDERPADEAGEAATEEAGTGDATDGEETDEYPPGGSVRYQDAETSQPRPPKPAELRARKKYEDKQREIEEARLAAEAKRHKRNRRLISGAAAIGVVGVVAGLGYWALSPSTVTAQCVRDDPNGQPVIVPDDYCTGHTPGLNGFFFWGGHSYRYYYGSSGTIGSRPIGGSTIAPKGATITTKSGSTIQRGGFGSKFGGGSKGGGSGKGGGS